MKKLLTVAKFELLRYFISPLAYVYLIAYLLLSSSFAIYFGHFFERNTADLSSLFSFQPWIFLLFIPGIAMRLWSEEFRNQTIIQITTLPVSTASLVWGKFLSAAVFCGLGLALTFPMIITVNLLGSPDNLVIFISYLGSFVLACAMLAISETMSALTKNQIISLVLAVVVNLLFFLSGIEYVLAFFRLFAPAPLVDLVASFSFLTHFQSVITGLVELKDIVFFLSIIILFNTLTCIIISFRTSGTSKLFKSESRAYYLAVSVVLLTGFIGLNMFANSFLRHPQFDFTQEKIFTLSQASKNILKNIKEPITAKVFYSKELGRRNPDIRQAFDRTRQLLEEFSKASNGRFEYIIYYPKLLDKLEDQAYAAELQPIPLIDLNQNAFFGISFVNAIDNKTSLPFISLNRQSFLEQDLVEKIYQLESKKKTVGIISGLPMFSTMMSESYVTQDWEIIKQISRFYNILKIEKPEDIDRVDVLMLVHPALSEEMIEKIKSYSDSGGGSLVLLDVAPEASRIYSPSNTRLTASNIGSLESYWGFKFHKELVVGDLENSITVDMTGNYQKNPYFIPDVIQFVLEKNNLNRQSPITKNLNSILFASASILEPTSENVAFVPLINDGPNSALLDVSFVQKNIPPNIILEKYKPDNFADKFIAALILSKDKTKPFAAIAVADTDFIYNSFWAKSESMLDKDYVTPIFDNANFILNSLDALANNNSLLELRGKSIQTRPFNGIESLKKNAHQQFIIKENELLEKINLTKKSLNEIVSKRNFEERQTFTTDEIAILAGIRSKLDSLRIELSELKINQDRQIKQIDMLIKFFNIYSLPLLILLGLSLAHIIKRKEPKTHAAVKFNKEFISLCIYSLLLLGLGISAFYLSNRNEINSYQDAPVFENLPDEINNITKISFKNHDTVLTFSKKDALWVLDQHPDFPVYQERIKSFLGTLLSAAYFEKKSDKAEHLYKFGLSPVESENSKNTRIELNAGSKKILSFEVGFHDIDIGRGATAAYIKFDNSFQVWLINADFIDLNLDWHNWTYSRLWDLRFGRFEGKDIDKLANISKAMLNAKILSQKTNPENLKKLDSLNLHIENGAHIVVDFWAADNKFYASYNFIKTNDRLNFFAPFAAGKYFEISKYDWGKIKNVAK